MTLAIYADASFRGRMKNACGAAAIIRIVGGPFLSRSTQLSTATSSHDAEAQAALFALTIAKLMAIGHDRDMREVLFFSDCESLVQSITNRRRSKAKSETMQKVFDAVDEIATRAQGFRAEHRTESSDPEILNVDFMSRMLLVSRKER